MNEKKQDFVKEYLEPLLEAAMLNVESCNYWMNRDREEYVTITTKTGQVYHISVTADSPIAIAADVINFMKYK